LLSDAVIRVEGLGKRYRIAAARGPYVTLRDVFARHAQSLGRRLLGRPPARRSYEELWALRDISFDVKSGECVGIIGRNGAGKSTLLKLLSRITEPSEGRFSIRGRVASLLEVGTGFHAELTGRENVYLNGSILGMRRKEIERKFDEIVAFAEVEKFLETPVKHYSSGMYMRLAFAVAAHLEPEILVVDEVLAVGDAQFQKKCLGKMQDVTSQGRTVLFVSHQMQAIRQLCKRALLIDRGRIGVDDTASQAIAQYFNSDNSQGAYMQLLPSNDEERQKAARFTSVRFLDSHGEPLHRIRRSDRLRVRITFRVAMQLPAVDVAMAIVYRDGQPIFSQTYSDQESVGPLTAGDHQIEFAFDPQYLMIDVYSLVLNISSDGRVLDYVEGIPIPELYDPDVDAFKESRRWGLVRLTVQWTRLERLQ
jgi:lipopolysaccharide transport system ATP-binding protein